MSETALLRLAPHELAPGRPYVEREEMAPPWHDELALSLWYGAALPLWRRAGGGQSAARRVVAQSTRVAYFGVQSGQAQVKALEAAESSSKLALEATQLGYRVGVRVNLDVLNAQTQLFQIQRELALARYQVLVGGLRLRQAAGQLTAADMATLGRLLQR